MRYVGNGVTKHLCRVYLRLPATPRHCSGKKKKRKKKARFNCMYTLPRKEKKKEKRKRKWRLVYVYTSLLPRHRHPEKPAGRPVGEKVGGKGRRIAVIIEKEKKKKKKKNKKVVWGIIYTLYEYM